jgi:hypothetical protein
MLRILKKKTLQSSRFYVHLMRWVLMTQKYSYNLQSFKEKHIHCNLKIQG